MAVKITVTQARELTGDKKLTLAVFNSTCQETEKKVEEIRLKYVANKA